MNSVAKGGLIEGCAEVALVKLRLAMLLTMTLLFGFLAAIFGLIVWWAGPGWDVWTGVLMAVVFAGFITFIQWWAGPWIIKRITRMKPLTKQEYPWLHAMVEDLAGKAGIKKPSLYVVEDDSPNAFAFGRTRDASSIALHAGLLRRLDKKEVEAVLAHEIGHVKNWDVAVITLASMVPLLVYYLVLFFGGARDRRGGFGFLAVWFGAMAASFLSRLIVLYLSRTREYYADAFSAVATRNPSALQSALRKIAYGYPARFPKDQQNKRAFYIADPVSSAKLSYAVKREPMARGEKLERRRSAMEFFGTHPLTFKRVDAREALKPRIESGEVTLESV